jgi:uncharacterized protein YciI
MSDPESRKVESMHFLLICRPRPGIDPSTAFPPHLAAELEALRNLQNRGRLVAAFTPDGPGAVLIVDADDLDGAQLAADNLPLSAAGVIDVEIIELHLIPGLSGPPTS